jgi:hypothetical protein
MQLRAGETVKRGEFRVGQIRDILVSISICRAASAGLYRRICWKLAGFDVRPPAPAARRVNAWFTNG